MTSKKTILLAAAVAGATTLMSFSAEAFWGPFSPWNWGGPGWGGPGWGGPWGGYGYAPYGYGYAPYGYGLPYGYGYGAPYALGAYPYGLALPGYALPAAAPESSDQ